MSKRNLAALVIIVLWALLVPACSFLQSRGEAPRLRDAYGNLDAYWTDVAVALGVDADQAQLSEWSLSYGAGGAPDVVRLVIRVNRTAEADDVYTVSQQGTGKPTWHRDRVSGSSPVPGVPAGPFFRALNRLGYRRLEAHQGIAPPIATWFHTTSGTIRYGDVMPASIIQGEQIMPVGPAGVTMQGSHGILQIKADSSRSLDANGTGGDSTAAQPGGGPPVYLMPELGCAPASGQPGSNPAVWSCGSHP